MTRCRGCGAIFDGAVASADVDECILCRDDAELEDADPAEDDDAIEESDVDELADDDEEDEREDDGVWT